MITRNNWLTIKPPPGFKVTIDPYIFNPVSFEEGVKDAALEIKVKYPKIYLSFSGGMDSTFVFETFMKYDVPFTPIIYLTDWQCLEVENAIATCLKYKKQLRVIRRGEARSFKQYIDRIYKPFGTKGFYYMGQYNVARICRDEGAVMITGAHSANEFVHHGDDMYLDHMEFFHERITPNWIPFFLYNQETVYATSKIAGRELIQSDALRQRLYGSKRKKVVMWATQDNIKEMVDKIEKATPNEDYHLGSPDEVARMFDEYVLHNKR